MKKNIFIVVLVYLWFEVEGQEKEQLDKINAIFNTSDTKNPTAIKPEGTECECVPYYLCTNNTITTNGVGLIFIREADECESYWDVCCAPSKKTETPIHPTPVPNKGCGYRNPDGVGFRITGHKKDEAQFGEFPWMVGILAEAFNASTNSMVNVYKCGGALIHPQAVVTAAHCVAAREEKYKIRAGEWDTQTTKELYPHQDRFVKSVVIHDKYDADALFNDVAILFLEEPVVIGETVNTLCLPEQDIVIPSGTKCLASGWGKDAYILKAKYHSILKKIDLPIVESGTCQEQLRKTVLSKYFILDKSFVCAGGEEGKDTCMGDGGSPLACPIPGEENRYQHVGMVSWGISCGESEVPGVYVNVPMFRHWIDEQISNQKLYPASYNY